MGEGHLGILHRTSFLGSPYGCGDPKEAVISDVRTSEWPVWHLPKPFYLGAISRSLSGNGGRKHWIFFLLLYILDVSTLT